ncbi:hypothetical protein MGYG_05810 [Nannizzia gypsea CBS 118893]|uniref:Oxysterol-binding protein n=1 Tax=Arthroderma gypseum (strain ATCC MYA-4604 / CBS 118893) TaxID=535722 RepID=E4UXX7_ARTGP|nr:hypothetical protein MGYG_05810 [Nannizzia gypsea CBS 118893]EFR02809.1 hypothetical protein MGYG_05810 [Nannizzia gypsea CBS 118893]
MKLGAHARGPALLVSPRNLCNWEVKDTEPAVVVPTGSSSGSGSKLGSKCNSKTASKESISAAPSIASTSASASVSALAGASTSTSASTSTAETRGITARGFDQISAKFTGTSVRITPGQHNLGIFITLSKRDNEEYRLTHPDAHLGGLLRGGLKAQHRVVGAVFRYNPDDDRISRIKDVPASDLLAEISGSWHDQIYFNLPASPKDKHLLIDVAPLFPAGKITPPTEKQLAYESRRLWADITAAINSKQYSLATRLKHELEESQRSKAAQRKENNLQWTPRFFTVTEQHIQPGRPHLTDDGRQALDNLHHDVFDLNEKLASPGESQR